MCHSGFWERIEFGVRGRISYSKQHPRAPGFCASLSVDTQYRRAKLEKMREEIMEEHTHGRTDIYVSWKERIVAAESLGDKKPVTKIRKIEETGSAEIMLEDGEVSASQLTIPTSFGVLQQTDVWICDTGASSHSTNSSSGGQNVKDTGSASLGHAGQALKATKTIDLPGQYVTKDETLGMKATLTEVNFNETHNFNLMSLTRPLMRGWHIETGDKTGIYISDGDGDKIAFDIVIPTAR